MLKYNLHLISGLFFELIDTHEEKEYQVKFVEYKGSEKAILYEVALKRGMWGKIPRRYLADYRVEVWDGEQLQEEISFFEHLRGKRVFICFESKSLGDTLAWMPYCDEFRKKYGCEVVVSTFMNYLFEHQYPELKLVGRGIVVEDIVAMIDIGWFYDKNKEPVHPATIPLQQAASNVLALEYEEILPNINFRPKQRPIEGKYVCISTHSTARLKYWTYWQEVIDYLVEQGYEVVEVSKDDTDLKSLTEIKDKSIPSVMNYLHHADFYMGLSSGISWLAWAMRKKVFMVANFSTKDHEFQTDCIRITDESVCHGCWNDPKYRFNKGDFYYCPSHEDTPNAFTCHFSINSGRVINELKKHGYCL